ncbi:hypothetical protein [Mesorhizobium ventifaucium]|uniref:Uncharacterized protein n=1 Tax=Mesorhizobium ventifaucium TaxID=666020 RepID=A0ABN8K836_9HYPH|nr:hypothetical protein [Mesorhizobium ventifaucium]CAH2404752.1 conserved hypothetical protein [Mesorhizobium ventifaucium]
MSKRYATIISDDDGREVVSAIGEFEGAPDVCHGQFEPVAVGVRIGMVRGGPVDAADGFGFAQMSVSVGAVVIARATLKTASGAGKSGSAAAARPDAARLDAVRRARKPKAKPGKRARKKPARPAKNAVKKTAKPAISAGTAG